MKLYIWNDPYHVDYGSSILIAVAENEEEARKQAVNGRKYLYGDFLEDERPENTIELGPPTRVVDIPCAEWYEWRE